MSGVLFPDIPKQLNDAYDFISKVIVDAGKLRRRFSDRELKKLVADFKKGVETINLICIKIKARREVARNNNAELHLNASERNDIESRMASLTDQLNKIVEMEAMQKFLREHPKLAEKAYIKLYGEHEPDEEPEKSEEELEKDFLNWIEDIGHYTDELLSELEEAMKKSS
jgi:hypothetical protein